MHRFTACYFAAIMAATSMADAKGAWATPTPPLYGICFSPYVEGASPPDDVASGEIKRLLGVVADPGVTSRIRTYGARSGLEEIPEFAHGKGFLEVAMGTWVGELWDKPGSSDPGWNPIPDSPELQTLISKASSGWVQTAVIGNEELSGSADQEPRLDRWKESDVSKLVTVIAAVQVQLESLGLRDPAGVFIPVTTCEPFDTWINLGDKNVYTTLLPLVQAVDIFCVNIYPFHLGTSIDDAIEQLDTMYGEALAAADAVDPEKDVMIGETGWPSQGAPVAEAIPSCDNARRYLRESAEWSRDNDASLYYFAAFDEKWKSPPDFQSHWGLWSEDGTPKTVGLSRAQRACVSQMSKSGARVNRTQLKENDSCLKDYQKGKLTSMTLEECTTAGRNGSVQRAKANTQKGEDRKCDTLPVPPLCGHTVSTSVNQAAVAGALNLIHAIFGDPVRDEDLATLAGDKATAECQSELLNQANKLENTALKEILKSEKDALKEVTIDSTSVFEEALLDVFTSSRKIAKAEEKLVEKTEKKCAGLQNPAAAFPGVCADPDLGVVEDCVIHVARCQACLKIAAFNDLSLDCDQIEDEMADGSCL